MRILGLLLLVGLAGAAGESAPDFPRLDRESDRQAFRRWFTFLAELQYYRAPEQLPREIRDCAGLLRFAYRESLRAHNAAWAAELDLPLLPSLPSVEEYRYPHPPLGAGLFRVASGAFAQFADAQTLQRFNTHFISRDLRRARPGDLLFFHQLQHNLPFHAMIFLGPSHFEKGRQDWLLYHTGPRGEIRRVTVEELLAHPVPQWRPLAGNSNFLGVCRWNLLREFE